MVTNNLINHSPPRVPFMNVRAFLCDFRRSFEVEPDTLALERYRSAHGDEDNVAALKDYVRFLYGEMPGRSGNPTLDAWGSYEAVANTIASQRAAHAEEADEVTT